MTDIRWKQRFDNYQKAVGYLKSESEKYADTDVDVIKKGIIQSFEITHELAWKLMQDILKWEGETEILGSKSASRLAFNRGLITHGEVWQEMIKSRNLTVHTYDVAVLTNEFNKIIHDYLPLFIAFEQRINALCQTLD
ncbi:Nucleotidyltransferase substrate binding protein [Bibersteinia trehalosi USDA-ARS-USMARC-188]|uniref:Nucleotidyltransferase substrate binding protein n=1 Tax=Bibersteinia trehalosi USDA-ARS-USMARC-188 TaxID=1263829 RepID=A0A4V7IBC5_BIBTR|nr:nucleotidyltransferase substrate binding protein [Bibersteinia trehalosi]AGH37930.1 Nucleotidyltransferase substrate binding protein [Bibersteinia trehalosi USDA-ARS-USMARC-192]AHG82271.1 Nucleotidyltransferase substrate binding protein [Bibersteinia trehalosi USDA-ARS-USMARC-188]